MLDLTRLFQANYLMNSINDLKKELQKLADLKKAKILQGFFKTGKGEYGEGDVFLGITVPQSRKIAIKFRNLSFSEIRELLKSKIHEERLIALLILVNNFNVGDEKTSHFARASRDKQKKIYNFYLKNTKYINNWDLVDLSADKIIGGFLFSKGSFYFAQDINSSILETLASSKNLWERRIAMIATYYFIKNNKFKEALQIAEILRSDKHDLIQKAVGWMLREVGKRDLKVEIGFLNEHYKKMPRTMLRYAIEKFPEKLRISYLGSKI